jgi:hypothetical protein
VSHPNEIHFDQTIVFRTAVDMVAKKMNDANDETYWRQVANAVLYIAGDHGYDAPTLAKLAIEKLTDSSRKKAALKELRAG